jgi:hypothetical protein
VVGYGHAISSNYGSIGGGFGNTASGPYCSIGGGKYNTATYNYQTIAGGFNNKINQAEYYSTIGGGNSNVSSNASTTVCGGEFNTASDVYASVAGGHKNTSSNLSSTVAGGGYNTSSGKYSGILGGKEGVANLYGMRAYSTGRFENVPSAGIDSGNLKQHVNFILSNLTNNNTPTLLWLDGETATNRLTIPINVSLFATITIAGISTDGTNATHYMRKVAIKNIDGTVGLIGSVTTIGTDFESNAGYDVTITADNTNKSLAINVTGGSGEYIRWIAHVDGVQIGVLLS